MPLPLTVSCFSKIQIGFNFLVPAHPGSPGQRAVKRECVCVCVKVSTLGASKTWSGNWFRGLTTRWLKKLRRTSRELRVVANVYLCPICSQFDTIKLKKSFTWTCCFVSLWLFCKSRRKRGLRMDSPPRGWQVRRRCGLSSKFVDHLSTLSRCFCFCFRFRFRKINAWKSQSTLRLVLSANSPTNKLTTFKNTG